MSHKSISARLAAPLGRSALAVGAASGLIFGIGAPAHAGAHAPDISGGTQTQTHAAAQPAAATPAAVSVPAAASTGRVHTVVSGDTLSGIAASYGVSLNSVFSANGLGMASIIYPGNQIRIPAGGAAAAPAPAVQPASVPAAAAQPAPTVRLASTSITPASVPAGAVPASGVGAALVSAAYSQLGATQDCTVLVERALRSIGKSVGDLAPTQFFQYGTPESTPAPGDLVISSGHVAIYIGNGQVISSGMNYVNETIVHPISWLSGYSFVRVA